MAQMVVRGGAQPWLGVQLLACAAVVLLLTRYTDSAHTLLRGAILVLWVCMAVTATLKEYRTYNLGDRIVLIGMMVILVLSIIAPIMGHGHIRAVSIGSIALAAIMLRKTIVNVIERQRQMEPFSGP